MATIVNVFSTLAEGQIAGVSTSVSNTATIAYNSTCLFSALVNDVRGASYEPADISSVSYTITDITDAETPTPVTGHNNVSLTVSNVFYSPEPRLYNGETIITNFEFTPSRSSYEPFPEAGKTYRVRIDIEPSSGFCSPLIYDIITE